MPASVWPFAPLAIFYSSIQVTPPAFCCRLSAPIGLFCLLQLLTLLSNFVFQTSHCIKDSIIALKFFTRHDIPHNYF